MSAVANEVRNKFEIVLSDLFLMISHNTTPFPKTVPKLARPYHVDKTIFAAVFSSSVLKRLLLLFIFAVSLLNCQCLPAENVKKSLLKPWLIRFLFYLMDWYQFIPVINWHLITPLTTCSTLTVRILFLHRLFKTIVSLLDCRLFIQKMSFALSKGQYKRLLRKVDRSR